MLRRVMICCFLAVFASDSFATGRKLAVVVGVDAYRTTANLPKLQHAGADAASLSEVLREQGFTVYEMTQSIAKEEGQEAMTPILPYIRDQIDGVLGFPNLGADDTVIISLHGHGVQFDDGKPETSKFYFCPADATVAGAKTNADLSDRNRLLPLDELYAQLANCKAATKLLIVDACRNDPTKPSVFRSGLASSTLPKLPAPTGGTAAFFSCKADQQAVEDPTLKHGVFTHYLVEGLRGKADQPLLNQPADGIVTFTELSAFVANNTYAHVYNTYRVRQSPELRGDYDLNVPLATVLFDPSLTNPVGMKFVPIPAGSFQMGSTDEGAGDGEKPVHRVAITKPFYAGKYEVTVGQVLQWLNAPDVRIDDDWVSDGGDYSPVKKSGSRWVRNTDNEFGQSNDQPMSCISWDGAVAYCEWLSQQDARFTYRLPTEAEWEYMARAGSTSAYPWGNSLNGDKANVNGTFPHGTKSKGPYKGVTVEVGSYAANVWGLHDAIGNVFEWCLDWYGSDYYGSSPLHDPQGPTSGSSRVLRGGSWNFAAVSARSACRVWTTPSDRFFLIGFRVVSE